MKIAHIVTLKEAVPPTSQNGLEFLVSWLVEELVRRGHEVTLFAPADSKTSAHLIPILPKSTNNDTTGYGQPYFSILNTIVAGMHAEEFDVIHSHEVFGAYIAPFINKPIIQTLHHSVRDEFIPTYIKSPEYEKLMKPVLNQYSKINYVAVSKNQEKAFAQSENIYFKKHTTIHNGINVEQFPFNETPEDYLFFIGYINKDKGADVAVQVARALDKRLIIAGNYFGQEAFFDEHIKPYLNDKIKYIGPADFETKCKLYKNALVTLAPMSWDEPFGLTLVESQACGTPVIAFNRGASSEIINDGKTGFVVNTIEEMIEAVKKVESVRRKDCRDWVVEKFSVKSMVDAYEKLYQEVINTKK
jgi:glycosyltransferase involved in cell wall biosynthesis